ncbi:pilus (MSHA type) biogenesis protein MshL [Rheinheimera marina]|uniref:Pilus (MSHA type) biogenesis protein MshL n=1 Tax=Rheinheimera marina TaxID=1774958 RepID=A0ABV9JG13_9GAMM
MIKQTSLVITFGCLSLLGCQGLEQTKVAREASAELAKAAAPEVREPTAVPDSVTQDLLAMTSPMQITAPVLPRFNVAAANVDVGDFFTSLVADTDYSVALHPAVTGQITLDLKQVTLAEAFAVVEQLYGFHIELVGQIYKVMPGGLRTETIAVNYLLMQRSGSSSLQVTAGGISASEGNNNGQFNSQQNSQMQSNQNGFDYNSQYQSGSGGQQSGSTIQSSNKTDFWKDLKEAVTGIIGGGQDRAVVISPQAGLVTVRAMPAEIDAVKAYLGQTERSLQRQVVLEAKIVEVTLNDDYQQGINWSEIAGSIGNTDFNFSTSGFGVVSSTTSTTSGRTNLDFSGPDFSGVIELLESQGNAQVLSSPRVTAINNQKAVIKVGTDAYFAVGVNPGYASTGSSSSTVQQATAEYSAIFSGIALDVTPQISPNNDVILHVHPSVSETTELPRSIGRDDTGQDIQVDFAQTNVRESDTIIKARNGEIVVIGGLMQSTISDSESKVPVLGSVPLVGKLFSRVSKVERKKELIILIKPTVVNAGVMQQQVQQSADLINQWYPKKN